MEFSLEAYWSGSPFPSPGDLPDTGIEPGSPSLQADSLPSEPPGKPRYTYTPVAAVVVSHLGPFPETGMHLEIVIQSEVSQKGKNKYLELTRICGI